MELLKHGEFTFGHILKDGYKVLINYRTIISTVTMANGSVRRNYGRMPKTIVKVKFGQLDRATYRQYISHFLLPEDNFTFYDTSTGNMLTKRFMIERDDDSIDFINDNEETHEEFSITLTQVGEVEVQNDNS